MRLEGRSYKQISSSLNISENTIKSFCQRSNLTNNKNSKPQIAFETNKTCKNCQKSLTHGAKGQPRKFCSEKCRRTWWKANESQLMKKAYYTLVCAECGKEFKSYGKKDRKFCGHACYIKNRFGKVGNAFDSGTV